MFIIQVLLDHHNNQILIKLENFYNNFTKNLLEKYSHYDEINEPRHKSLVVWSLVLSI